MRIDQLRNWNTVPAAAGQMVFITWQISTWFEMFLFLLSQKRKMQTHENDKSAKTSSCDQTGVAGQTCCSWTLQQRRIFSQHQLLNKLYIQQCINRYWPCYCYCLFKHCTVFVLQHKPCWFLSDNIKIPVKTKFEI